MGEGMATGGIVSRKNTVTSLWVGKFELSHLRGSHLYFIAIFPKTLQ